MGPAQLGGHRPGDEARDGGPSACRHRAPDPGSRAVPLAEERIGPDPAVARRRVGDGRRAHCPALRSPPHDGRPQPHDLDVGPPPCPRASRAAPGLRSAGGQPPRNPPVGPPDQVGVPSRHLTCRDPGRQTSQKDGAEPRDAGRSRATRPGRRGARGQRLPAREEEVPQPLLWRALHRLSATHRPSATTSVKPVTGRCGKSMPGGQRVASRDQMGRPSVNSGPHAADACAAAGRRLVEEDKIASS
jgi:hypothetical protein